MNPGAGGVVSAPGSTEVEFLKMRLVKNSEAYPGHLALSILAGWSAAPYQPQHLSLEALAAEVEDIAERDAAARVAFSRKAGSVSHG
jgi:hypothetical protein